MNKDFAPVPQERRINNAGVSLTDVEWAALNELVAQTENRNALGRDVLLHVLAMPNAAAFVLECMADRERNRAIVYGRQNGKAGGA